MASLIDSGYANPTYLVALDTRYVSNHIAVASTACYVYDWFLTLPREVRYIWQRKPSIASLLFLVNRYATLCVIALGLVQLVSWDGYDSHFADRSCAIAFRFIDAFTILMYLAFTLFVAARTYAIWDKNKLVLISVLGLGLLYPVGYMYYCSQRGAKASLSPAIGCQFVSTLPAGTSLNAAQGHIFEVLGAVVGILFECLTVALTWVKMIFVVRQLRRSNMSNQPSLSRVMFYNGTLHFTVILIANVLSVLLNAFGVLTNITQTLTSILVTRFILDLREDYYVTSENDNDDVSVHVSYLSDVRFVSQGPVVTVFSASDPSLGTRMTDGP